MRGDEVAHVPGDRAGADVDGAGLFEAIVVDPIGSQEQLALPRQGRAAEGVSAGPHAQCLARASRAGDQCLDLRRGARACDRIVFADVGELRSEERREGKGWVSTCKYRGWPEK